MAMFMLLLPLLIGVAYAGTADVPNDLLQLPDDESVGVQPVIDPAAPLPDLDRELYFVRDEGWRSDRRDRHVGAWLPRNFHENAHGIRESQSYARSIIVRRLI